ncbi:MAG: hypothetical protein ACLQIB_32450 [Isosphaeraceae bacterium]
MTDGKSSPGLTAISLLLFVVLAGVLRAEDWRREVDALRPRDVTSRSAAVLDSLERRARESLATIRRSHTAADADRVRARLRRKLERSLGVG